MKAKFIFTFLLVATLSFVVHAQEKMRIHLINVGQGCATLVEFPCAAILIDTGGEKNGYYSSSDALQTYLEDFFNRRTDLNHTFAAVYITHPHIDHTRGVPVIMQPPYVIKNIITDGLENESIGCAGQKKLHRLAQDSDTDADTTNHIGLEAVVVSEIGSTGYTNDIIDPVNCSGINPDIKVLWGTTVENPGWTKKQFENENNHSLVIKIVYKQSSFLVIGDLEDTAQSLLVSKYNSNTALDADVYLVGHHCSKNGTTQALLTKMTPKIALIGVGDMTHHTTFTAWAHGHPNKGILDILQINLTATRNPFVIKAGDGSENFSDYTINKGIYATAWDGNIILETKGDKMWSKVDATTLEASEPVTDGASTLPQININTATITDLETLPGIGPEKAQAIYSYRNSNGNFSTIEELDNVPGIGPATIDLVRPYARIN